MLECSIHRMFGWHVAGFAHGSSRQIQSREGSIVGFEGVEYVWLNGRIVPWKDATTHVSAHALHYGTGVFEGIRSYDGPSGPAVFRLPEHIDRLFASAAAYNLLHPFSPQQLIDATVEVVAANGMRNAYIRPLVWSGSEHLGIRVDSPIDVAILALADMGHVNAVTKENGVRVTLSPYRKIHTSMIPSTAKACGQYLNSRLAIREAMARGFDSALLLNTDGTVAEGAVENLFVVRDGRFITNDARSSILMGITRDAVLGLAEDLGIETEVRALTPQDLWEADEAFFTGTASEITPIREFDDRPIGAGGRGPLTKRVQDAFDAATTGTSPTRAAWRTPVKGLAATAAAS